MKSKKFTLALFIFYCLVLTWIIIFKVQFSFENLPHFRSLNLIPFRESAIVNDKMNFDEIIQNMLVFIPFGIFMRVLLEEKMLLKQFIPIIFTSLLFEGIQYIFSIGASDITDVISNSLGGVIGIAIALVLSKITRKNWITLINMISLVGGITLTLLTVILLLANM